MVDVALLGTGGMLPLPNRYLTAMMLRYCGKQILVDCGEGTQVAIRNTKFGYKKIDYICFTHFHADHIAGLPGLLLTIGNSGREEPLTIIGPLGLEQVVKSLMVIAKEIPYKLKFIEIEKPEDFSCTVFNDLLEIKAISLKHGNIQCIGYSFNVKRVGKFNPEKARLNGVPVEVWSTLQRCENTTYEGEVYTKNQVLDEERKGIKVTYGTDSRPFDDFSEFAKDSDLFICEGLYGDDERLFTAQKHNHMIVSEACKLAKTAKVKELWLTHFSPAFTEPLEYENFAKELFIGAKIGEDGKSCTIEFEKN
ncbi:MAG: ribonuclease Z [Lachnospirales bacterium]